MNTVSTLVFIFGKKWGKKTVFMSFIWRSLTFSHNILQVRLLKNVILQGLWFMKLIQCDIFLSVLFWHFLTDFFFCNKNIILNYHLHHLLLNLLCDSHIVCVMTKNLFQVVFLNFVVFCGDVEECVYIHFIFKLNIPFHTVKFSWNG